MKPPHSDPLGVLVAMGAGATMLEDTASLCCKKGTASHLTLGISVNAEWEKVNAVSKQPSAQRNFQVSVEQERSLCFWGTVYEIT